MNKLESFIYDLNNISRDFKTLSEESQTKIKLQIASLNKKIKITKTQFLQNQEKIRKAVFQSRLFFD